MYNFVGALIIWSAVIICGVLVNEEHIRCELACKNAYGYDKPRLRKQASFWSIVLGVWPFVTVFFSFMLFLAGTAELDRANMDSTPRYLMVFGVSFVLYSIILAARSFRRWRHNSKLHPPNTETGKDQPTNHSE